MGLKLQQETFRCDITKELSAYEAAQALKEIVSQVQEISNLGFLNSAVNIIEHVSFELSHQRKNKCPESLINSLY